MGTEPVFYDSIEAYLENEMPLSKEEKQILEDLRQGQLDILKRTTELKTVLLGTDSDKGLVGQVNDNTKKITRNTIVLAVLSAVVFGSGGYGIAQIITG